MAKKTIHYTAREVCADFLINTSLSLFMGIAVWGIGLVLPFSQIIVLIVQIMVGIVLYILISIITKNSSYIYCIQTITEVMNSFVHRK